MPETFLGFVSSIIHRTKWKEERKVYNETYEKLCNEYWDRLKKIREGLVLSPFQKRVYDLLELDDYETGSSPILFLGLSIKEEEVSPTFCPICGCDNKLLESNFHAKDEKNPFSYWDLTCSRCGFEGELEPDIKE